ARELWLSRETVRECRNRFLESGVPGVAGTAFASPVPRLPVRIPRELAGESGRAGRPPVARLRIEAWVRDCAARGLFRRGEALPSRTWFEKRFRATPSTVQDAFDALARQGFAKSVGGKGTFLPEALPFDGRYLLLVTSGLDALEGIDASMVAAARLQEKSRGVAWDVARIRPASVEPHPPLLRKVAMQRYAGVFMRSSSKARYAYVDNVPMGGFITKGLPGNLVRGFPRIDGHLPRSLVPACRAAGCSRPLVVDQVAPDADAPATVDESARERAVRAAAAEAGLDLAPDAYLPVSRFHAGQLHRMLRLAFSSPALAGFDSVVSLEDNLAPPLCDALVGHFGAASARRVRVFSSGSLPPALETSLPVEWHGFDWTATLDSFAAWCDAVHSGDESAPLPRLVER
ncbi:MAG: GntR family transcriptional regulator, partial [Kiritimatiellae bacterium]|nr:GntR family transcriptional regulator [Kiritimatiellia bacterium]